MRETKDQKIARLERKVNELNQLLKGKKSERKEIANDYKTKHEQLQLQIKEMKRLHKQEVSELRAEIQKLEIDIAKEKETSQLVRAHNTFLEQEIDEIQGVSESKVPPEYLELIQRDNEARLESFNMGLPTDKWWVPFICPNTLLLAINPNTGDRFCWDEEHALFELVKNEPFYHEALVSVRDFQAAARRGDLDALEITHKKGMEVYHKLYPDYFSKQQSL